ncbi:MFS transporter [Paenibacillus polysaccharolyticus]|uniref:MFS transporter n=2 Tax=Paenibacillus TaxID=44249 RepID=UPI0012B7E5BE|nr:MFS transporter [Paenibacillus polysaccharolyticus]MCP1136345.1 MFS transporter [Paenibacillus polysaccharolyticus]MDP9700995.1 MFS family permease [Paenibacillus intestini]
MVKMNPSSLGKPRRKGSTQRTNLSIATWEGVPAIILQTLLGGPFLTGFLLYLGAGSRHIGFVLAITTFVNIAQIGAAYWMQRIRSRKRALLLFVGGHRILWSATGLIPFIFPKEWWVSVFIGLYTVAFICNTIGGMIWTSLIGDIVPAKVRGRYFGIRNTILNALGSVCLFGGGILLDRYPGETGFLILFIPVWICAIANTVIYFFYPDLPFERSTEKSFSRMFIKPFQDRVFLKATIFLAAWLLIQTLIVPLYSYVMLDLLKVSYQMVSLITVVQTLVMMGGFYIWGNLNARYSNKTLLFWTLPVIALSCLSWGLMSFTPVLVALFLSHIFLGIGVGGFNQLAFNFTIGDTPKSERPMFIAVYSALTGVTSFIGPLIGGWLYEKMETLSEAMVWISTYGFQVTVGAVMLLLTFTLGRRVLLK